MFILDFLNELNKVHEQKGTGVSGCPKLDGDEDQNKGVVDDVCLESQDVDGGIGISPGKELLYEEGGGEDGNGASDPGASDTDGLLGDTSSDVLDSVPDDNEFKMPSNFDIPQDYILEIAPRKKKKLKPEERLANLGVPANPLSAASLSANSSTSVPCSLGGLLDPVELPVVKPPSPGLPSNSITGSTIAPMPSCPLVNMKLVAKPLAHSEAIKSTEDHKKCPKPEDEKLSYYPDEKSSKSTKATKRLMSGDLKRNRKQKSFLADLFGEGSQESEPNVSGTPRFRKEFETFKDSSGRLKPGEEPGRSIY